LDAESYPDPFSEGMMHGLFRAMQVASCTATAAQVVIYQQKAQARASAERSDLARRALQQQARAEREAVRLGWEPALDPHWLRQADLLRVAQAWGLAVPYAERGEPWHDPTAAIAVRRCEERLRDLHPYAMAFYDRLRSEDVGQIEAMASAAPLFARYPRPYDASSAPRSSLDAGAGTVVPWLAEELTPDTDGADGSETLARRGREIVDGLQARAAEKGRDPLGAAELRVVLESITNLPDEVIDQAIGATDPRSEPTGEKARPGRARRDVQPWQRDFPTPIGDVVKFAPRTTATTDPQTASRKPTEKRTPRRPGS
jgi:hypothetical protein